MYCTQADLESRFGADELADLTLGDTAKIVQAIEDATALINGYIAGRCQLPLPTVPAVLVSLCADIARYRLYDEVLDAEHQAARRYQSAIKYLENVGTGRLSLGVPEHQAPCSNNTAEFTSAGSVFARDKSHGFL
ncbi:TPA: gp436 family protein [Vibrio cholerae]